MRWTVITNCDSFFITNCDTVYYKLRQVLQSAMDLLQIATGITKCDDYYKLRQYRRPLAKFAIWTVGSDGKGSLILESKNISKAPFPYTEKRVDKNAGFSCDFINSYPCHLKF